MHAFVVLYDSVPHKTDLFPYFSSFQVLGFAAFFALVLKKIDQEEYGEPQIDVSLGNTGKLHSCHFIISFKSVWTYFVTVINLWQHTTHLWDQLRFATHGRITIRRSSWLFW